MHVVEIWGTDGTWAINDIMQVRFVKRCLKIRKFAANGIEERETMYRT
jgi:hypothetical protein